MLKVLLMSVLIFMGMVGYDTMKNDEPQPSPANPAKQEEKYRESHEEKAAKALFFSLLPPKEEWPEPMHKFYMAMNMDEFVEPIRQHPDWTPLSTMSRDIPQALIAIEDHEFYSHGGIDINGVIRALLVNLSAGEVVQGGSTLSQQLVKNVFLTHEQSMERKIEEAVLTLVLESKYSKDEILELYLNTTYFGAGANGIKDASRAYFAKAPSALTLAEAAVIASLPYAPTALNPLENPEGCKKRQLLVLQAMNKWGLINESQLAEAKAETIHLANGRSM